MSGAKNIKIPGEAETGSAESAGRLRVGPMVRPARSGRVLVIDDEVAVGRTIQRLLGDRHDVVVVTSGAQAMDLFLAGSEFDVVLCDISMPEMNGMEVQERAIACRPELADRFVFMTGGSYSPKTREFFDSEARTRIDKPFDLEALRSLVRERIAQVH